jgi:hypothetical protein
MGGIREVLYSTLARSHSCDFSCVCRQPVVSQAVASLVFRWLHVCMYCLQTWRIRSTILWSISPHLLARGSSVSIATRRVVKLGETLQQLAGHLSGHSVRMGASDLAFRLYGALGADGYCDQGATYAGQPNEACGGYTSWVTTERGLVPRPSPWSFGTPTNLEMEVWYPVARESTQ